MPPTLLIKGNLKDHRGDPMRQKELDNWVPLEYVLNWFKERKNLTGMRNRVLILKSEVASGKSTALVAETYINLVYEKGVPGMIVTQPRTLTAIRNVSEMVFRSGSTYPTYLRIGETVGWSTKHNKLRPKKHGLVSATVGTLAAQLKSMTDEEILDNFSYILLDECHERSLELDMTFYLLKNFLKRNANNPRCPFICAMSATFDHQTFLKYFELPIETNYIWVTGMSFGFDEMWDWNAGRTFNNYTQAAALAVERIIATPETNDAGGDVLIFMPGSAQIEETRRWLTKLNEQRVANKQSPVQILTVDAEAVRTDSRDYQLIDVPLANQKVKINGAEYLPERRVIISTAVAETGLTLGQLKYVVDSGFSKEIEFNPNYGIRSLIAKPAPVSRIRQRMGRCGRRFRGAFYPLYPKHIYDKLPLQQYPQILMEDISPIVLDIINEQIRSKKLSNLPEEFKLEDIDMLDVPSVDSLHYCLEKLYALGFLSPAPKYGLSDFGQFVSRFSMIGPENLRMIFASFSWECSTLDMITVAAYLSMSPKDFAVGASGINWNKIYQQGLSVYLRDGSYYRNRLLICDDFINGLILFSAMKNIIKGDAVLELKKWCDDVCLSYSALIAFIRARDDIIEQMLANEIDIFANESLALRSVKEAEFVNTITKIKYCIYDGWRLNQLRLIGGVYYSRGIPVSTPLLVARNEINLRDAEKYGVDRIIQPVRLLYRELSLKEDLKTGNYSVRADAVCSLDGYVNDDDSYLN